MSFLPPPELRAQLDPRVFDRRHLRHLPALADFDTASVQPEYSRRAFLASASAALAAFGLAAPQDALAQLVFSPEDEAAKPESVPQEHTQTLQIGQIPADFWTRPRELWLRRHKVPNEVRVVYWKDGQLVPDGYLQACALLRDVRANLMTTMDPTMLDILCGILGFYQAWRWPHPVVVTSGFRTAQTNSALSKEGAAKNSMHLYGRAADIFIPGIPTKDVTQLGMYFRQGGVGFYPDQGFTHLDTGRLRVWRGGSKR